jgi:hypothetical protein
LHRTNVRIGAETGSKRKLVGIVIAAVILVCAAVAIMCRWWSGSEPVKKIGRCAEDADCGAGRLCARGGCLPIIGSEGLGAWRTELDEQAKPDSGWRPHPEYGERLVATDTCPIPVGSAEPLEATKVSLVHLARVIEIRREGLRVHVQLREKGARWMEAMRFTFPFGPVDLSRACASRGVSHAAAVRDRPDALDVALRQTVPVGAAAAAAVTAEMALPPADRDGLRLLEIPLDPVSGDAVAVSVVAVPLGATIDRMGGPAPSRQRLLRSHVVYYWRHEVEQRKIVISISVEAASDTPLSLDDIKP